jgi:SAM-dependent methyltransferase
MEREELDVARADYAQRWQDNSLAHDEAGDYDWMASQLPVGTRRVLEVGCGSGRSTHALVRAGASVVSVDENPHCIKSAGQRLMSAGIVVDELYRGSPRMLGHRYVVDYDEIDKDRSLGRVTLVEGHVGFDDDVFDWLAQYEFDAIVCWLIGAQTALGRHAMWNDPALRHYAEHGGQGVRLSVQNRLYLMAEHLLRPGGVLHTVDRKERSDDAALQLRLIDSLMESHRDQAEGTSMRVVGPVGVRPWAPPTNGVAMQDTSPSAPRDEAPTGLLGLCSVLAVRS